MNVFQFLRIFWARRNVVFVTTAATVLGAIIAILIVPPRYEAVSRVMLNILKPDPVTGEVISSVSTRTYIATQTELIRDFGVAGLTVDALNWADNPDIIAQYQSLRNNDLDIRRWLSQRVIDGTGVKVVGGTNILEISYRGRTPSEAKAMANALRDAYIQSTLETRRREATRTADWFVAQAEKERALLNAADAAKTAFEKENGVFMQGDTDVDTARLNSLAGQASAPAVTFAPAVAASAPSSASLTQLDAAIAQASQSLGPNHPQLIQMRAQRAALAQVVAQEMAAARASAGAAASAANSSGAALRRELDAQTAKVIGNREKVQRLTQLQEEVKVRREQYNRSMARIAELRQEAAIADPGISVLGEAVTPQKPSFPNTPLILGGALAMGFGMGILLSLLLELTGRRVRSIEDIEGAIDAPLLAVIDSAPGRKRGLGLPTFKLPRVGRRPGRGKLAQA